MVTIRWMIFKPEGNDVLYFYNGETVYIAHVAPHEGKWNDWSWLHDSTGALDEALEDGDMGTYERHLLNEVTINARKRIFNVKRKGNRRFQVVERGHYTYDNT